MVLRKADKQWVRPAEQEADLAKAEKETLVNLFGRKRGGPYQSITKKIVLSTKEPVEVRKADKRWVRPAEPEPDLAKAEKETQVTFDESHDPVTMVIYRYCSGNLLAY